MLFFISVEELSGDWIMETDSHGIRYTVSDSLEGLDSFAIELENAANSWSLQSKLIKYYSLIWKSYILKYKVSEILASYTL